MAAEIEIGSRPVLRPAGNIAPRANLRKESSKPAAMVKKATKRISPTNSPPTTPKQKQKEEMEAKKKKKESKPKEEMETKEKGGNPKVEVQSLDSPLFKGCSGFGEADSEAISASKSTPSPAMASLAAAAPSKKKKKAMAKKMIHVGGISFDEEALAGIVAAKKAAASQVMAQKKLKVAEYGRQQQRKSSRVSPELPSPSPLLSAQLRRCKFITPQTDPLYVEYHDEEWGVPVHEDRMLFELLVLAGFQVELNWATILHKRDAYRISFSGFDAATVASFSEKYIQSLEADKDLALPKSKIRGAVENAKKILEVVREFGSLNDYLWGFLNNKQPMVNNYRYPKQVPVKTSKSESISKDLVRRGFRFVGPTIIYSFMQAAGMTNDHLVQCFRHQECLRASSVASNLREDNKQEEKAFSCNVDDEEAGQEEPEGVSNGLEEAWVSSVQDQVSHQAMPVPES